MPSGTINHSHYCLETEFKYRSRQQLRVQDSKSGQGVKEEWHPLSPMPITETAANQGHLGTCVGKRADRTFLCARYTAL